MNVRTPFFRFCLTYALCYWCLYTIVHFVVPALSHRSSGLEVSADDKMSWRRLTAPLTGFAVFVDTDRATVVDFAGRRFELRGLSPLDASVLRRYQARVKPATISDPANGRVAVADAVAIPHPTVARSGAGIARFQGHFFGRVIGFEPASTGETTLLIADRHGAAYRIEHLTEFTLETLSAYEREDPHQIVRVDVNADGSSLAVRAEERT